MTNKGADYFKRLLESQNRQSQVFVSKERVSRKAREASYLVAERSWWERNNARV
jgi:hypothetical protein